LCRSGVLRSGRSGLLRSGSVGLLRSRFVRRLRQGLRTDGLVQEDAPRPLLQEQQLLPGRRLCAGLCPDLCRSLRSGLCRSLRPDLRGSGLRRLQLSTTGTLAC
jgi:hypothetical protein